MVDYARANFKPLYMKTFSGSCHCQTVQFEVDADIDHVRACDCSICSKRGALIIRVEAEHFRLSTPLAQLSVYRWGTKTGADYFCPTCGILPFRKPSALTPAEVASGAVPFDGWSVNARCLAELELSSIPVRTIYGSRL